MEINLTVNGSEDEANALYRLLFKRFSRSVWEKSGDGYKIFV